MYLNLGTGTVSADIRIVRVRLLLRPELRSPGECRYVVCPGISDIADILPEVENIAASAIIKNILLMKLLPRAN